MNRSHLIDKIATETGVTKMLADQMIDSMLKAIVDSLKREEKVKIKDFGSWEISSLKPRKGVNPLTGAPIHIQAKKRPRFKAGKRLDKVLNRATK